MVLFLPCEGTGQQASLDSEAALEPHLSTRAASPPPATALCPQQDKMARVGNKPQHPHSFRSHAAGDRKRKQDTAPACKTKTVQSFEKPACRERLEAPAPTKGWKQQCLDRHALCHLWHLIPHCSRDTKGCFSACLRLPAKITFTNLQTLGSRETPMWSLEEQRISALPNKGVQNKPILCPFQLHFHKFSDKVYSSDCIQWLKP